MLNKYKIFLFIWFTFTVSEWRVKIRKEMNDQDTAANQKAVDSLLNFETVKYFNAEKVEAERFDSSMQLYETAALKTSYSLSFLNIGQTILISIGLITVMVMGASGVQNGTLTVGDFVLINAYMIQITMPLNFLGTVYREIRQGHPWTPSRKTHLLNTFRFLVFSLKSAFYCCMVF